MPRDLHGQLATTADQNGPATSHDRAGPPPRWVTVPRPPGAATRPQSQALYTPGRWRQPVGAAVAASGLGADCVAALWVLDGWDGQGLLLHFPAVLVWVTGVWLLTKTPLRCRALDGWTTIALVAALVPFPAIGALGMTLARGMAWLLKLAPRRPVPTNSGVGSQHELLPAMHGSPLYELNVQPIVDLFGGAALELKLVASAALARTPSPHGVQVLRSLLDGVDPDLRNAAALALFRIEAGFERALSQAEEVDNMSPPAELAGLCVQYAHSGLLDDVSSDLYLGKACTALEQAIAEDPASADLRFRLASLQRDLGRVAEAQQMLESALDRGTASMHSYLLGMGVAFRDGRWEKLVGLARQAGRVGTGHDESDELVRWWARAERKAVGSAR
jgi:hypothetical protein